jgi:hypothetical protein
MRTFVADILNSDPNHPDLIGRPRTSSQAVAAVLLDKAGVDPDSLARGVTEVRMPAAAADVERQVIDLISAAVSPIPVQRDKVGYYGPGTVAMLTSALDGSTLDIAFRDALRSAPAVIWIGDADYDDPPEDLDIHVDRTHDFAGALTDDDLGKVVALVTGEDGRAAGLAEKLDIADVLTTVRPSLRANDAFARLRKIVDKREHAAEAARAAAAAALAAQAALAEFHKDEHSPDAQAIVDAAAKVVVKLSDLTGYGPAKSWGMQLAADIAAYKRGEIAWDDLDKGVLVSGPPGCGKTFFAGALAAECGCELVATAYGEWHDSSSGDTVARSLKKLFGEWRKKAEKGPIIVFIDEIDSMGARGKNGHSEGWYRTIINSWLAFLDGADPRKNIICIAATNLPDLVDDAMKRPGRLERHIELPAPTIDSLAGVIKHHIGAPASDDALREAAVACRGRSPAEVAQTCRDARRIARRQKRTATPQDVAEAARAGTPKRPDSVDAHVVRHEAAHALVAFVLGEQLRFADADAAHVRVTFDLTVATRSDIERQIIISLSGRAADALWGEGETAGARSDLETATSFAQGLVGRYGMDGTLASLSDAAIAHMPEVRAAVDKVLSLCDKRARDLLGQHEADHAILSDALRRRRYLDGTEIAEIIEAARQGRRDAARENRMALFRRLAMSPAQAKYGFEPGDLEPNSVEF